jgi:hypothetical protein
MDYSYLGSGKIYLREVGAAAGLREVGNCSALAFNVTEDVRELRDFTQPGGGTYNEVRRVTAVEMTFTAHDFSPENLSLALYGNSSVIASSAQTNQAMGAGYKGMFLPFLRPALATPAPVIRATNGRTAATRASSTAVALNAYLVPATPNGFYYRVSVAGTTGASVPTFPTVVGQTVVDGTATLMCMGRVLLTAGTDYTLTAGGIELAANAALTDGEPIESDTTPAAGNLVQALTTSGKEYEVVFVGLNEARSGKEVTIRAFRAKIGAAQNLALIGEDFGALELTGKLLKDTAITGAGLSQYFTAAIVQ